MNQSRWGAAFTLIELLVVIALLGLIIAAVLTGMNGAKRKAYDTRALACAQDIRTKEQLTQTATSAYGPLSSLRNLNCAGLSPQGNGVPAGYIFQVKHPRGVTTYTVTASDLYVNGVAKSGKTLADDAAQTDVGWQNSGGVIPSPNPPTAANGATFTVQFPASQRSANYAATLTHEGRTYPLTFTPDGAAYVSTTPNLKPGTYTVTLRTTAAQCVGLVPDLICPAWDSPTVDGNLRSGATVSQDVTVTAGGYNLIMATAPIPGETAYASINNSNATRTAHVARNIARAELVKIINTTDAFSTACTGPCDETNPGTWTAYPTNCFVNFTANTNSTTTNCAVREWGVYRVKYTPIDATQPMNLSGLSTAPVVLSLRKGFTFYVNVRDRNTTNPADDVFTIDLRRITTNPADGVIVSYSSAAPDVCTAGLYLAQMGGLTCAVQ